MHPKNAIEKCIKPYYISSTSIDTILKDKNVELNDKNRNKLRTAYENAISSPYCAIFLDIDGTLVDNSEEKPNDEIIRILAQLTYKKVTICFITGRGRSSRGLLFDLAISILKYSKDIESLNLNWESFSHWYCITGSGTFLLYSKVASETGFLFEEEEFIEATILQPFNREKKIILQKALNILTQSGNNVTTQYEEASFRCVTSYVYEKNIFIVNQLYEQLNDMLAREFAHIRGLNVVKGIYRNSVVFEIGVADKKSAIEKFNNEYLGIDPENILRIGDSGALGEIDYGFLDNKKGFTVNTTQENIDACFPVFEFAKKTDRQAILLGTEATCYLLENLAIYPTLCVKIANKKKYIDQLSEIEKKASLGSSKIMNYYSNMINWFDFFEEANCFTPKLYQIFDVQTGAVVFSDTEWYYLKNCNPKDFMAPIITSKYTIDNVQINRPEYSYFMETDTGVLFRGAKLYYQFMYQSKICLKTEMTEEIVKEWLNSFRCFRRIFVEQIKNFFKDKIYINAINRKLLIGGFDNIRNCLLILINLYIQRNILENTPSMGEYDFIIHLEDNDDQSRSKAAIKKLTEHLKSILICIYELVFSTDVNIQMILEAVNNQFDNDMNLTTPEDLCSADLAAFRNWREVDFVVENFAAIEMYFKKNLKNNVNKQSFAFWGLPYGAIELPIIAQIVCEKYSIKSTIHYISLNGNYEKRHAKSRNAKPLFYNDNYIQKIRLSKNIVHVLIDDNITTARTLELAAQCLSYNRIFIHDIIVVRYLSLNRSEHIFGNKENDKLNASAPQLDRFFNTIIGLVRPSPYSKLFEFGLYKEHDRVYEDELGIFDKSKQEILEYLIKNYGYSSESKQEVKEFITSLFSEKDVQKWNLLFQKFIYEKKTYGYLGELFDE